MNGEDRSFYGAIIIACIIGMIIISYTIMSSPKYEENFTELYFYGEKVGLSEGEGEFGNYMIRLTDDGVFLVDRADQAEMGPFIRGSTIILGDSYWYIEDISSDGDEMLFRKIPLRATQGDVINGTFVIVNHKNRDLSYVYTVKTPIYSEEGSVTIGDGSKEVLDFFATLPVIDPEALEKTGEYTEEFDTYSRLVEEFGEYKRITLSDGSGTIDQYWRAKVSISLNTGEEIHFWIILDDE
ncbi:MAG: hypothetical protein JW825_02705 [Candidatus Methanofastidiosa archaeon]|nr:hypothetical protein [Candidatus Methanofastidiosa archaeon]